MLGNQVACDTRLSTTLCRVQFCFWFRWNVLTQPTTYIGVIAADTRYTSVIMLGYLCASKWLTTRISTKGARLSLPQIFEMRGRQPVAAACWGLVPVTTALLGSRLMGCQDLPSLRVFCSEETKVLTGGTTSLRQTEQERSVVLNQKLHTNTLHIANCIS